MMKGSGNAIEASSVEEMYAGMKAKLADLVPDAELLLKADLAFQINQLKRERNAVILGHNYMEPALYHSVPDYVGDSLELSRISAQTEAEVIVFCGVQFMAETAKVLNPGKCVLIPAEKAGCSLAEGITVDDVQPEQVRLKLRPRANGEGAGLGTDASPVEPPLANED